jgi:hypothetical protein
VEKEEVEQHPEHVVGSVRQEEEECELDHS